MQFSRRILILNALELLGLSLQALSATSFDSQLRPGQSPAPPFSLHAPHNDETNLMLYPDSIAHDSKALGQFPKESLSARTRSGDKAGSQGRVGHQSLVKPDSASLTKTKHSTALSRASHGSSKLIPRTPSGQPGRNQHVPNTSGHSREHGTPQLQTQDEQEAHEQLYSVPRQPTSHTPQSPPMKRMRLSKYLKGHDSVPRFLLGPKGELARSPMFDERPLSPYAKQAIKIMTQIKSLRDQDRHHRNEQRTGQGRSPFKGSSTPDKLVRNPPPMQLYRLPPPPTSHTPQSPPMERIRLSKYLKGHDSVPRFLLGPKGELARSPMFDERPLSPYAKQAIKIMTQIKSLRDQDRHHHNEQRTGQGRSPFTGSSTPDKLVRNPPPMQLYRLPPPPPPPQHSGSGSGSRQHSAPSSQQRQQHYFEDIDTANVDPYVRPGRNRLLRTD